MKHRKDERARREQKKEQFSEQAKRRGGWTLWLIVAALLAVVIYVVASRNSHVGITPSASANTIQITPEMNEVRIPLSKISNGQAKFFNVKLPNNTSSQFFVIKTSDGVYRAALDACEVCFDAHKGYYQDGDQMVCRKCGRHFSVNTVNNGTRGCHPVGLTRRVDGNDLVIPASELQGGAEYFQ